MNEGAMSEAFVSWKLRMSRLEIIDHRKAPGHDRRIVVIAKDDRNCEVSFSIQDGGQTLKIFLAD